MWVNLTFASELPEGASEQIAVLDKTNEPSLDEDSAALDLCFLVCFLKGSHSKIVELCNDLGGWDADGNKS